MSEAYIMVIAILQDMPNEVNQWVRKGYVPLGGPIATGERGISSAKFAQAMFREPAVPSTLGRDFAMGKTLDPGCGDVGEHGITWPTTEELEEAVREANAAVPGSASSGYSPNRTIQDELNFAALDHFLSERAAFVAMPLNQQRELLASAESVFRDAVAALRTTQQKPYIKHTAPTEPDAIFDRIQTLIRARFGVINEHIAGLRARDPEAKPTITVDLADAQKIYSLVESNSRAQYPTEHQRAVERFSRRVLGVQDEE